MPTTSVKALALAVAALLAPTQAVSAQNYVAPEAEQIELLCPQIGLNGLTIGAPESREDYASTDEWEGLAPYPLTSATLDYTTWSRRLAAISWRGAGFEGMEAVPWRSDVSTALERGGWELHSDPEADERFEPAEYHKSIVTADGPREFAVRVANSGNFELTCGDARLMSLSQAEASGDLEPGSPRPVPPDPSWEQVADIWLARFDCDNPEWIAAFSAEDGLDKTAAIVAALIGYPPDLAAESDYQNRLATWLKWTIRNSGKLSDEEFWAMEDAAVTYDTHEATEDFAALIGTAASLIEAEKANDGQTLCKATHSLFEGTRTSATREANRTARANTIRIEHARKLGVAVD